MISQQTVSVINAFTQYPTYIFGDWQADLDSKFYASLTQRVEDPDKGQLWGSDTAKFAISDQEFDLAEKSIIVPDFSNQYFRA